MPCDHQEQRSRTAAFVGQTCPPPSQQLQHPSVPKGESVPSALPQYVSISRTSKVANLSPTIGAAISKTCKPQKPNHARALWNSNVAETSHPNRPKHDAHALMKHIDSGAKARARGGTMKPLYWIDKPWAELPRGQFKDVLTGSKLSAASPANVRANALGGSSRRAKRHRQIQHPAGSARLRPATQASPCLAAMPEAGKIQHRRFRPHVNRTRAKQDMSIPICSRPVSADTAGVCPKDALAAFPHDREPARSLAAIRKQARSCLTKN